MNVSDAIEHRISIRAFQDRPVSRDVVADLLQKAARAPSGGNLQPWRVYALAGAPLAAFKAEIAKNPMGEPMEYDVYPPSLWDPFRTRRFENGEQLYASVSVSREDKAARLRWFARNAEFFGAPVGLFFCLDRKLGPPQWADLGMYMQNVMLLAVPTFEALMQVFAAFRERLDLFAFEFFTDIALRHVLAHGAQPPFGEVHPYYVVAEFAADDAGQAGALAAFEHCLELALVVDGVISQSDAQSAQLWQLREGITESLARYQPYKNDVSVRISAMPAFLAETTALLAQGYPQYEVVWFGHIGDGNLHINVLKPDNVDTAEFVRECESVTRLLVEVLARHGGSISAEHGIGLVKKPYLEGTRSQPEIALMRGIREVFDPNGIMNPGKLLDR